MAAAHGPCDGLFDSDNSGAELDGFWAVDIPGDADLERRDINLSDINVSLVGTDEISLLSDDLSEPPNPLHSPGQTVPMDIAIVGWVGDKCSSVGERVDRLGQK